MYLDNIRIQKHSDDEGLMISIRDIHTLVLDNYKAVMSVQLVNALTSENVNVVFCGVDHKPQSILLPMKGNEQAPRMLQRQISWRQKVKSFLHKEIIRAKIINQYNLLRHFDLDPGKVEILKGYAEDVRLGDTTNREGLAAKVYFHELFGSAFRRFEEDPINHALNYGYAILRSMISKQIVAKGLHPSLGLFHNGPNNFYNLSDDFIEVFRPLVDWHVRKKSSLNEPFDRNHKMALIEHLTCNIYYKDQSQTLFNAITQYIDHIVSIAEIGDITNGVDHPVIDYERL